MPCLHMSFIFDIFDMMLPIPLITPDYAYASRHATMPRHYAIDTIRCCQAYADCFAAAAANIDAAIFRCRSFHYASDAIR